MGRTELEDEMTRDEANTNKSIELVVIWYLKQVEQTNGHFHRQNTNSVKIWSGIF